MKSAKFGNSLKCEANFFYCCISSSNQLIPRLDIPLKIIPISVLKVNVHILIVFDLMCE